MKDMLGGQIHFVIFIHKVTHSNISHTIWWRIQNVNPRVNSCVIAHAIRTKIGNCCLAILDTELDNM